MEPSGAGIRDKPFLLRWPPAPGTDWSFLEESEPRGTVRSRAHGCCVAKRWSPRMGERYCCEPGHIADPQSSNARSASKDSSGTGSWGSKGKCASSSCLSGWSWVNAQRK